MGYHTPTVTKLVEDEGTRASRRGMAKLPSLVNATNSMAIQAGCGRPAMPL